MLLVAVAVVILLTVPLTGGTLLRLADVRPRSPWLLWLAVAAQFCAGATSRVPHLSPALHVASYGVLSVLLWRNRGLARLGVVALGGVLNLLAIVANRGVMPASPTALRSAGLSAADHFSNSAPVSGARLAFLGDVFATPAWVPLANVFSVGDVLIWLGFGLLVHTVARAPSSPGHPASRGRIRLGRALPAAAERPDRFVNWGCRQRDPHQRPPAGVLLEPDQSPVGGDDLPHDRQT
jgi:hypothetical protein